MRQRHNVMRCNYGRLDNVEINNVQKQQCEDTLKYVKNQQSERRKKEIKPLRNFEKSASTDF